jgi:hypothetical protein
MNVKLDAKTIKFLSSYGSHLDSIFWRCTTQDKVKIVLDIVLNFKLYFDSFAN